MLVGSWCIIGLDPVDHSDTSLSALSVGQIVKLMSDCVCYDEVYCVTLLNLMPVE